MDIVTNPAPTDFDKLLGYIEHDVDGELKRANKKHGSNFSSAHEAFAVMLEEFEESGRASEALRQALNRYWEAVKADDTEEAEKQIAGVYRIAVAAAGELIQVAAMAKKAGHGYIRDDRTPDPTATARPQPVGRNGEDTNE